MVKDMRLIDADALKTVVNEDINRCYALGIGSVGPLSHFLEQIDSTPTIDAEPVRHEGNTTFVSTNNLDAYADRIIVGQGTSCKVYYADEPVRHGRWTRGETNTLHKTKYYCSECGGWMYFRNGGRNGLWAHYCPNCGAKMDAEVEG